MPPSSQLRPGPFRVLAVTLLAVLTIPRMLQRAMFIDGMFYASVARNLAFGQGHFWAPSYSQTIYAQYFDHPPLGLALESLAFRLLGDSFAAERVYSLVMLGLSAWLITRLWRIWFPAEYDWLPIALWTLPAIVTWAAVNNMLENTQAVATTAAVFAAVRAARASRRRLASGWAVVAVLATDAAILVKGPVGFFPLAVPLLVLILPPAERQQAGWAGTVTAVAFAISVGLVLATPAPSHYLTRYIDDQLAPTFAHRPPILVQVVAVWRQLAGGLLVRLAAVPVVLWLVARVGARPGRIPRAAWFLVAVALAGSLPLLVSPKIDGHYLLPAAALFALAAAAVALPAASALVEWARRPVGRWVPAAAATTLLLVATGTFAVHGVVERRDPAQVAAMDRLASLVPRHSVLGTCGAAATQWGLLAYLQRFLRVSRDPMDRPANGWFVEPPGVPCHVPAACQRTATTAALSLYRCPDGRSLPR